MKLLFFLLMFAVIGLGLFSPSFVLAQNPNSCSKLSDDFTELTGGTPDGLVEQCASPDAFIIRLIRVMLILAGSIAIISIMISGLRLVVQSQDSKARASAVAALRWSVVGLVLLLTATAIVSIVTRLLSTNTLF